MCRFSIIVPLLGQVDRFEDTLASVLRHRPDDAQIIIVHEGRYSDPYDLGEEVKFIAADEGAGLIGLLNNALCYAAGEFTVVVRPGIELDESWDHSIAATMSDDVAAVVPLIVNQKKANRVVAAGVNVDKSGTRNLAGCGKRVSHFSRQSTGKDHPLGPTLWLAAYKTGVLKALTPLDESLASGFVDADIALSIQSLGFTAAVCDDFVGQVEDVDPLVGEASLAHGTCAQRVGQRFGDVPFDGLIANLVADLVRCPLSTWRMSHLFQRLSAPKWTDTDFQHANRLARLAKDRPWEAGTDKTDDADWRRAA